MSFTIVALLALLISISTSSYSTRVEAKPIVDNYAVKFRRAPPRQFSVAMGASMTIECEAFSVPPPNIHWLKNGKRIPQDRDEENNLDDSYPLPDGVRQAVPKGATRSRLFIDCIDDKDEAIYTCVAENPFSRVSTSTALTVIKPARKLLTNPEEDLLSNAMDVDVAALELQQAANGQETQASSKGLSAMPQCLSEKNSRNLEPMRIHFWTQSVLEEQKKNVLLFCRSNLRKQQQASQLTSKIQQQQSQDLFKQLKSTLNSELELQQQQQQQQQDFKGNAPTLTWTTPDEKVITSDMKDKYEILDSGDLLVKNLSWTDMGIFICTVSDEFSSDSISSFIYPASDKPAKSKRALLAASNGLNF